MEKRNTLNKKDLIDFIANKTNSNKKDILNAINIVTEGIIDAIQDGNDILIVGFGGFQVKSRSEHIGYNPNTREEIIIPERKHITFKAGSRLKDAGK